MWKWLILIICIIIVLIIAYQWWYSRSGKEIIDSSIIPESMENFGIFISKDGKPTEEIYYIARKSGATALISPKNSPYIFIAYGKIRFVKKLGSTVYKL